MIFVIISAAQMKTLYVIYWLLFQYSRNARVLVLFYQEMWLGL